MKLLSVKNFLLLKNVEIEVKKINIIIGSQASGKSIIAKLVHYFNGIGKHFQNSIIEGLPIKEAKKNAINEFEKNFPISSWNGTSFEISYNSFGQIIKINGNVVKNKTKIEIEIPEDLTSFYAQSNRKLSRIKNDTSETINILRSPRTTYFNKVIKPSISNEAFSGFFHNPIFIPASRSFFSSLSNNIFSFLASNVNIDPYIKEFGSFYESSKSAYIDQYLTKRIEPATFADLRKRVQSLIKGNYVYKNKQDLISTSHGQIPLSNASSGQQEVIPLLLVLSIYPFFRSNSEELYFIEEPEAHLFPDAQGDIVSLFSFIHHKCNTGYFITTHSPYVLAAFNNLILASNLIRNDSLSLNESIKINSNGFPIDFENVSAYIINNGICESILDEENNLINTSKIDSVSEKFAIAMDEMLGASHA